MTTTHIYFLLDRTGSMAPMAADVIGGFNGFLAAQRAEGADARLTLVQFDSQDPFEVLADAQTLDRVANLTPATFQPRGSTPLLDATANLISHATGRVEVRRGLGKPAEHILFVTFTDGEENASRHHSRADVMRLVADRQAQGWTFVFLGAGLDAYAESGSLGYAAGSVQAWAPDAQGAREAFSALSTATAGHRARVRAGAPVSPAAFWGDEKTAEEDRKRRSGS
jgi:hypothetical protein